MTNNYVQEYFTCILSLSEQKADDRPEGVTQMRNLRSVLWASFVVGVLGVSACTTAVVDKPAAEATGATTVKKKDESMMKGTDTGSKARSEEKEKIMSFD